MLLFFKCLYSILTGTFFCNICIIHVKELNCKSELFFLGEANILKVFAEEANG